MKMRWIFTFLMVSSLTVPFVATDADARGGRGGGFSRGGVASGGGFSGGSARQNRQSSGREVNRQEASGQHQGNREDWSNDNREDRRDFKEGNREDWQDYGEDRQDDRQDFIDDELDDNWDHHNNHWDDDGDFAAGVIVGGVMVGAAAAASYNVNQVTYVTALPCQATAVSIEGVSYYKCSSVWYQRGYAGSQVTFIQVAAPPGF
jgi:hypothetical protein